MTLRGFMLFLLAAPAWGLFLYALGFGLRMYVDDLLCSFWRRKSLANPDWSRLRAGEIQWATDEQIKRQREHLHRSCEVHGYHTQRNSPMALIGHPLKMDEGAPLFRHMPE
jgi:hypothetical protein